VRERANAGESERDESRGDSETEVRIERDMFGRVYVYCTAALCGACCVCVVCAIDFLKNFRS
jgi:hypothetical protein